MSSIVRKAARAVTGRASSSSAAAGGSEMAKKTWELANQMQCVDDLYSYNEKQQQDIRAAKPWDKE
ncbi:MAG: hypothetical protein GY737_20305 [Desulfobacteraceae bacterium]|nr:hypothetical protein [Desulfobacteraceae bacterium]